MNAPIRLKDYELYGRIRHTDTPLRLFAIGDSNWNYYADIYGTIYSIVKPDIKGCEGTYFGTTDHIYNLIQRGIWSGELTEYGKMLMSVEV